MVAGDVIPHIHKSLITETTHKAVAPKASTTPAKETTSAATAEPQQFQAY